MAWCTKSCLTCRKLMPADARFCPRCGGAFLRASESLFGGIAPRSAGPAVHVRTSDPTLLARPLAWYAGFLLRRAWLAVLTFW